MIETNFDNQKDREQALADFKGLLVNPGWQRLVFIVDTNIEVVKNQILNGLTGETKETIDRLRDKLTVYKEIMGTAAYWIDKLEPEDNPPEINDDPFTTVELENNKLNKV
jgi:hypothetical protein